MQSARTITLAFILFELYPFESHQLICSYKCSLNVQYNMTPKVGGGGWGERGGGGGGGGGRHLCFCRKTNSSYSVILIWF